MVASLESSGLSVWWDDDLTPRQSWDAEIEREIARAGAVLVLWSAKSVAEDSFVRREAGYALDHQKLVPMKVEACDLPLRFRDVQTAYVPGCERLDASNAEWRRVLGWIETLLSVAVSAKPDDSANPARPRVSRRMLALAGAGAAGIAVAGAVLLNRPSITRAAEVSARGRARGVTPTAVRVFDGVLEAWRPDFSRLLIGSRKGLSIVDGASGHQLSTHEHQSRPSISASGALIATATDDHSVQTWNGSFQQEVRTFRGHEDTVYHASFSPDETLLISTSNDKSARLWRVRSGSLTALLQHRVAVFDATFSPDGQRVVTTFDDGAMLWDAASGTLIASLYNGLSAARFSSNGDRLFTAGKDEDIYIWDGRTGGELGRLAAHTASVSDLAFSADGGKIISASEDQTVRIWDAATRSMLVRCEGHEYGVTTACLSPNGLWAATGSYDNTARIWDANTGDELAVLRGHSEPVRQVAFSEDSANVITSGDDGDVILWDI